MSNYYKTGEKKTYPLYRTSALPHDTNHLSKTNNLHDIAATTMHAVK
jgi:hypothetical protein